MTNKSSQTIPIFLAIALLVLIGILVFGIYDIKIKNAEVSRILNETGQTAQNEKLIDSIKALQENNAEDIQTLETIVFTSNKLVPLIEDVEGVGRTLGLETKIASVSEFNDKSTTGPKLIRIAIETTKGSWSGTLAFLKAIENLPHRVLIDEAVLSKEDKSWRLRMTISIHIFN